MDFEIKEEYLTSRQLRIMFSINRITLMRILQNNNIEKKKLKFKNGWYRWLINTKDFVKYLEQFNK